MYIATPTPMGEFGFHMQEEGTTMTAKAYGLDETQPAGALPALKPEDAQYFGKLLTDVEVNVVRSLQGEGVFEIWLYSFKGARKKVKRAWG